MSEIDKLRAELLDATNRITRLENLQQDPTAYRHTSEPRAWAAVESLIAVGVASGSAVEEMKAAFPILVLLSERMQERHRLIAAVSALEANNAGLREGIVQVQNDLAACNASRLTSENQVYSLTSRLRKLQREQRDARKLVSRYYPKLKTKRKQRKR